MYLKISYIVKHCFEPLPFLMPGGSGICTFPRFCEARSAQFSLYSFIVYRGLIEHLHYTKWSSFTHIHSMFLICSSVLQMSPSLIKGKAICLFFLSCYFQEESETFFFRSLKNENPTTY